MENISTSTNFNQNTTFTVDEIDIDTNRPYVESSHGANHFDMHVKQIRVKEQRFTLTGNEKQKNKQFWKTPISQNINNVKIKPRVLTPFHQELSDRNKHFNRFANLSTIVASGEPRMIPDIIVTEFFDENNNEITCEDKESINYSENYSTHSKLDEASDQVINRTPDQSNKNISKKPCGNVDINIKPIACIHPSKCQCCNKSIMKITENNRMFVSNSVNANLAIDEFHSEKLTQNFDTDSLTYLEPAINQVIQTKSNVVESYDNDYYLMNEFLSSEQKEKTPKRNEYFYFYCSLEKYKEINQKRLIKQEPMIIDGELKNAITLLTLSPECSDLTILNELFERNTPIDLRRIESYIIIKREILERHKEHLIKVSDNKYLFKRSIILEGKFPNKWLKTKS